MRTYLITGGSGFIGSNFIHYLFEQYGDKVWVINLDALSYCGNNDNLRDIESLKGYQFIYGDVCDEELVERIFCENDIDYVVHFAAESHVDRSIEDAKVFVQTNVVGTLTLLEVIRKEWTDNGNNQEHKRFLYVSTDEVYGELQETGFFTEDSPLSPRNPYSVSKASADMLTKAYFETYKLPVLITRCSNNYGPSQYKEKLIPICLKQLLEGNKVKVYGDGKNVRDWLYVKDHCRAIEMVLQDGKLGQVYNIGGHNEKTTVEIVEAIRHILQEEYELEVPSIEYVADRLGHDRRYAIDPTKIAEELGWQASISFDEGIRKTVSWYMNHKEFIL